MRASVARFTPARLASNVYQTNPGGPLTPIPHEPVGSRRCGAAFSLPIRAKLGLFFFRASASRPLSRVSLPVPPQSSTVLQDLAFFACLRLCAKHPFPHAYL